MRQNFMDSLDTRNINGEIMVGNIIKKYLLPLEIITNRLKQRCVYNDEIWLIDDIVIGNGCTEIRLWRPDRYTKIKGEEWKDLKFEKNGKMYKKS